MATATRGEAGRRGADVRSDCFVQFEHRDSGGIEIQLTSRVAPFYGDSIRRQAQRMLAQFGIVHASLVIEDQGALPFVIDARIEAAILRAGGNAPSAGVSAPMPSVQQRAMMPRDRIRRSRLYLPGNEPKYFINAALHEPDAIILDLEDSVHPAEKDAARILVRNALRFVDFGCSERMVRINQLPLGLKDLQEIVPERPNVILLPKAETAEEVLELERVIEELSQEAQEDRIWLMPILESAMGIENAFAIASASKRVCALTIGLEDYTADLAVPKTSEGSESLYSRMRLVNAAKAAGVQANDSAWGDVGDMQGLRQWAERSRALGFEGMGCVHPSQIAIINQAFAPSGDEITRALQIVAAFEDAQKRGLAVVSLGSKMIDPPVVTRALRLVACARELRLFADAAVEGGGR